ncbi:MAG: Fe-S cluster protein [Gemmatimonadetes bacterium]|nr:Fe-S cluster protein [Gemmatimonadota bacterium]NIO33279.1 Fe-S cluster protein [Gemmatimonadota bacterium]
MDLAAIAVSVAILGGVALTFAILIALANKKLKVWEDPRIDAVSDMLPGSNCGACGSAGCRAFAEELVDGKVQPASCTQLGAEDVVDIAEYLGVDAGEAVKRVARLFCAGGSHVSLRRAEYIGLETCGAAAAVGSGGKGCAWSCLGLADCERACDYDAIYMNHYGLPVVIPDRCTACEDCVEACPRDLFEVMPITHKLIVQCKSLLEGDEAEEICKVACTGCGLCATDAAAGLIEMKNGLAVIDYSKNELADLKAIERCPTNAIVWVEGQQFADMPQPIRSEVA